MLKTFKMNVEGEPDFLMTSDIEYWTAFEREYSTFLIAVRTEGDAKNFASQLGMTVISVKETEQDELENPNWIIRDGESL